MVNATIQRRHVLPILVPVVDALLAEQPIMAALVTVRALHSIHVRGAVVAVVPSLATLVAGAVLVVLPQLSVASS